MYQKEIIYISLTRNGDKIRNAGFARVESRDGKSRIFLQVQNIPHAIGGVFSIRLYDGQTWMENEKIDIREGKGAGQIEGAGLKAGIQVQIILPEGYLLYGKSKYATDAEFESRLKNEVRQEEYTETVREEMPAMTAHKREETPVISTRKREETPAITVWEKEETPVITVREREEIPVMTAQEREAKPAQQEDNKMTVVWETQKPLPPTETQTVGNVRWENRQAVMKNAEQKEDKWEQILDTYDRIHPYGDSRTYVKIEPKDFIILQEKYQHLVNNSFLLHGFYNYRYVILGKENGYYLGVPGVFYEREKMVAMMFGFEAFECEGGMAKPGGFGYYLRKVEL